MHIVASINAGVPDRNFSAKETNLRISLSIESLETYYRRGTTNPPQPGHLKAGAFHPDRSISVPQLLHVNAGRFLAR